MVPPQPCGSVGCLSGPSRTTVSGQGRIPRRWFPLLTLLLPIVLFLGVLSACGSSEEVPAEHYFRVEQTDDGVPLAITSAVPKYRAPLFTFTEEVRLHQDENVPESLLNRAYNYVRAEDGTYVVVDSGDDRIVLFDSNGTYLRQIGRRGDGPGEFQSPRLLWVRGGRIAVYDSRHRRTCLFRMDGTLLQTFSAPTSGGTVTELHPVEDGRRVLVRYTSIRHPDRSYDARYDAVVESADGDTIAVVEGRTELHVGASITVEGMAISPPDYFAPMSYLYYRPGVGILSFWTGEPGFELYNLDGQLERRFRIDLQQLPVTQEEMDGIVHYYEEEAEKTEDERQRALSRALAEHMVFREMKPYYQGVTVDDYGYFWWVDVPDYSTLLRQTLPSVLVRLLSPEGEYLGDTPFPASATQLSNGYLCTYQENEETGEAEYIVYRMESAVPGFVYP